MTEHFTKTTPAHISGLILAGGKGQRMGQRDKGLLTLTDKSLVEIKIAQFAPQVSELLISANRNLDSYRAYGYPVITDASPDYPGPLAGIARGLQACKSDWLVSCPCDTPTLVGDYVARMWQGCQENNCHIAVAHDGERAQNTFLLLHRSMLDSVNHALAKKDFAVYKWLAQHAVVQVDFSAAQAMFINFNSPEDITNYVDKK